MATTKNAGAGILSEANAAKREEIVELLTQAYWMEMETVMSYLANGSNLDGIRAEEVAEALDEDVNEELGHARAFAQRIKELYGTPPGSAEFTSTQSFQQPPADAADVVTVIKCVIEA
jgi:bacterioferritin